MGSVNAAAIRDHYDSMALVYRLFWGEHLHHGLFLIGDEHPRRAQEQMLKFCLHLLALAPAATVLDVGCGYGGTCIYLARNHAARVTGITLSRKQAQFAGNSARRHRVHDRVNFVVADVEEYAFAESNYDLIWTMESSEHFRDKGAYFRKAANALRPRGKVLVSAWTAARIDDQLATLAEAAVCHRFETTTGYVQHMEAAGLRVTVVEDVTYAVARTWEICRRRACVASLFKPLFPQSARDFVRVIDLMLYGFRSGALTYTVMIAEKDGR